MAVNLITATSEKIPEQTELQTPRERDEFQQTVDQDVSALKLATAKAAWPKPDPKRLYHRYVVAKEDRAELKSVIRRAAALHKVEAIFYKDGKTEQGHVVVKFHVARKLAKDGKSFVADDTLGEDGKPKAVRAA